MKEITALDSLSIAGGNYQLTLQLVVPENSVGQAVKNYIDYLVTQPTSNPEIINSFTALILNNQNLRGVKMPSITFVQI